MYDDISSALTEAAEDKGVSVAVITGICRNILYWYFITFSGI